MNQGAGKGTLYFVSSPSGAEVYLDNQYRGSTPATLADVEIGNHTLEYRYQGYDNWSAPVTVISGPSQFYAALSPMTEARQVQKPSGQVTQQAQLLPEVTIQVSKDPMIVGDSITFSGTCTGSTSVLLTIYGPGYYAKGVQVGESRPNAAGLWSFTWSPGTSVQSGTYSVVANDARNITSDGASFRVIGGGLVAVTTSSFSASPGDKILFSGQCTTGAQNVMLVLNGPGRYSAGIELGSVSVQADNTWSFRYTLDSTMPAGVYTIYAYDIPKTTSGTAQFTVGYASSS